MASESVLLHVCCANCLFDVLKAIEGRDWRVGLLFGNPNIQPLLEYRRRMKSVLLTPYLAAMPLAVSPAAAVW